MIDAADLPINLTADTRRDNPSAAAMQNLLNELMRHAALGVYNVLDYGATGDGVTNDYAAVQATIDAAEAAGGGTVLFPPGIYLVGTTPTLNDDGVTLIGYGSASVIKSSSTSVSCLYLGQNASYSDYNYISGLKLEMPANASVAAFVIRGARHFGLRNLVVYRGLYGIQCQNMNGFTFDNIEISGFMDTGGGLRLLDGSGPTDEHCVVGHFMNVVSTGKFPLRIDVISGDAEQEVNRLEFSGCAFDGDDIAGSAAIRFDAGMRLSTFVGCLFKAAEVLVDASTATSGTKVRPSFIGCSFFGTAVVTVSCFKASSGNHFFMVYDAGYDHITNVFHKTGGSPTFLIGGGQEIFTITNLTAGSPIMLGVGVEDIVLQASGTGSIASGATTATITHGLSVTPAAKNISIVFTEQGTADYGRWWLSSIGATTFQLNVSADPGASNLDFSWNARV